MGILPPHSESRYALLVLGWRVLVNHSIGDFVRVNVLVSFDRRAFTDQMTNSQAGRTDYILIYAGRRIIYTPARIRKKNTDYT
jgi:hypothetical protein